MGFSMPSNGLAATTWTHWRDGSVPIHASLRFTAAEHWNLRYP
jgi:hypothetical protein